MADRELFSSKSGKWIGCRRWFQASVEGGLKFLARSPILARGIDVEHDYSRRSRSKCPPTPRNSQRNALGQGSVTVGGHFEESCRPLPISWACTGRLVVDPRSAPQKRHLVGAGSRAEHTSISRCDSRQIGLTGHIRGHLTSICPTRPVRGIVIDLLKQPPGRRSLEKCGHTAGRGLNQHTAVLAHANLTTSRHRLKSTQP